jgi:hypothetical protein
MNYKIGYNTDYGKGPSEYGLLTEMSNEINLFLDKLLMYNKNKDLNETSNCEIMEDEKINASKETMYNFFREIILNESILKLDNMAVTMQTYNNEMYENRKYENIVPCDNIDYFIKKSLEGGLYKRKLLIHLLYEFFTSDLQKKFSDIKV